MVASARDFHKIVASGRELATLHIGYETANPFPLLATGCRVRGWLRTELYDYYRVEKMRFVAGKKDRSAIYLQLPDHGVRNPR